MRPHSICMSRCLVALALVCVVVRPAFAGPITSGVWYEFAFTDTGVSPTGCQPNDPLGGFCTPSSGTPTTFADAPEWTFFAGTPTTLTVTDAFEATDRFEILDNGLPIGMTSPLVVGALIDCGDDPVVCLGTPGVSTGVFALAAGPHSFTIVPLESGTGGAAYFQVDVPEPTSVLLLATGLVAALRRRRALR